MRAQRRFALLARIALAALLAATALLGASAGVAAADNPVTLDVLFGYQGVVRPGEWMPVAVVAKNTGAAIDGTVELQEVLSGQPGVSGFPVYQSPISLVGGAVKRIRGYVVVSTTGATIRARIVQNGRVIASQDSSSGFATTTMIGVLSDQSTSFDGFAAVHPASVAARVVHLRADDIAESAIPLRAFDILAVDDFATDSLTAGQRTAISDYVRNGGNLLLGAGAAWHKTLAGLPAAVLPMDVNGTVVVNATELGGTRVEVATGSAAQARVWLSSGGHPLLVERSLGAGMVTMATFDWNQDVSGSAALLRQILARALFRPTGTNQAFVPGFGAPGPPFGFQQSVSSKSSALVSVLGNLPSLDLPSFQLTGGLVLLYVLLVGPANYFVLGAFRRRALAWVTVPLIALIAAGGAYGAGVLTKGRSVQANQVTILHLQPGWDHAYQETYTGIIAPSRGDYQASVAGARMLISPIANYGGGYYGSGVISSTAYGPGSPTGPGGIRVNVDNNGVTLPGMTAFVLGGFATETITAAPQLTAHVQLVNGTFTGTIENHSNLTFTDAVLIAGDGFQTFGALKPGASATVSLEPKPGNPFGQPTYTRIYGSGNFYGPQPYGQATDAQRESLAKTQVLSVLPTGASFKGTAPAVAPLLVAWTHQSLQDITVNGSHPRSTALTAVALSLPVDQIGTGSLPAGVVNGRIVDVVGDTQGGPPGMLVMQNGSVTYEFTPQLATGVHLTGASLNSSNQYGGKFFGPPGVTGRPGDQMLHSEVWDWAHSAWSDVAFQTNGSTAIPDTAVNPGTGAVRFRLSSNGGFSASAITLSGTVQ